MRYIKFLKSLKTKDAEVYFNHDLKRETSFKIGGKAKYFVVVKNEKTLLEILSRCKKFFILGGGTNTLFADKNFDLTFIKLGGNFKRIYCGKSTITAFAGAPLSALCFEARKNSFGGLEFLFGIPGTVGGAIFGNAGAFNQDILSCAEKIKVLKDGKIFWTKSFTYSYRSSNFKKDGSIILAATFSVLKADQNQIDQKMKEYMRNRKETQPIGQFSAGSVFKRDKIGEENIIPAKIIDNLGLKGVKIKDAKVSEKHAGFIVNAGMARFKDVYNLIQLIKKTVYKNCKIKLEEEIVIFGGKKIATARRLPHPHSLQPRKGNNFRKCNGCEKKGTKNNCNNRPWLQP